MDALSQEWANRAKTAANGSDANFWSVMASTHQLPNMKLDHFRFEILRELASKTESLLGDLDAKRSPNSADIQRIKELISQQNAISAMFNR